MNKKSIVDVDVTGRRVLVRADLNVPLHDCEIADDSRIRAALPTLRHLVAHGAKTILCSHLGRPDGKRVDELSLAPIADLIAELLEQEVRLSSDCVGPNAEKAADGLGQGELLLLENTRFHPGEERNDADFAAALAKLGDLFVNDAFGAAHRAHASTEGVARHLPAVAGLLMRREIEALLPVRGGPGHPYIAIFGGAKVSGKIRTLDRMLDSLDRVLLGGVFVATFLAGNGTEVGESRYDEGDLDAARALRERAGDKLVLPVDVTIATAEEADADHETVAVDGIRPGWRVLDIGPRSVERFRAALENADTVVWNGPLGAFELEPFSDGTASLARAVADCGAKTFVGGGDTVAAIEQAEVADRMTHVSTGGGAFLAFISGERLACIEALQDSES